MREAIRKPVKFGVKMNAVGTGTIAFQSCSALTFTYALTGGSLSGTSGSMSLTRVGPVPPGRVS